MTDFVITAQAQEKAGNLIVNSLIKAGVRTVLLIDSAGNVLANCGHEQAELDIDAISLAAFRPRGTLPRALGRPRARSLGPRLG